MHKGFYYKLAFTNLGKNRKFYLPYMLSCILMVMLHFILCSLSYTDTWQTIPESAIVYTILNLGCYVVEIFALILLFYTNGFLMKRRKREFGLYNVLGMEKRHIGRVLFWETFFAFSASILVGLGLGILLSKLAELLLCNMLQFEIRYAWEFIPRAFLRTGSIFLLYAALMLLHSLWQLRKAKPVELLHSVSAGEREPRANWLLALLAGHHHPEPGGRPGLVLCGCDSGDFGHLRLLHRRERGGSEAAASDEGLLLQNQSLHLRGRYAPPDEAERRWPGHHLHPVHHGSGHGLRHRQPVCGQQRHSS